MDGFSQDNLAAAFAENRQRLISLAEKRLNPILLKRLSVEDVLSEMYANAAKRLGYKEGQRTCILANRRAVAARQRHIVENGFKNGTRWRIGRFAAKCALQGALRIIWQGAGSKADKISQSHNQRANPLIVFHALIALNTFNHLTL